MNLIIINLLYTYSIVNIHIIIIDIPTVILHNTLSTLFVEGI